MSLAFCHNKRLSLLTLALLQWRSTALRKEPRRESQKERPKEKMGLKGSPKVSKIKVRVKVLEKIPQNVLQPSMISVCIVASMATLRGNCWKLNGKPGTARVNQVADETPSVAGSAAPSKASTSLPSSASAVRLFSSMVSLAVKILISNFVI